MYYNIYGFGSFLYFSGLNSKGASLIAGAFLLPVIIRTVPEKRYEENAAFTMVCVNDGVIQHAINAA